MVKPFLLLLLIVTVTSALKGFSQEIAFGNVLVRESDSLVKKIKVEKASFLCCDANGNIYTISDRNTLLRFDTEGKPSGHYNNIQNGDLTWVDASNPLKILLYYPQYTTLVFLDKMLSPKATLNLQQIGLTDVSACGMAEDGNFWVYDNTKAHLLKINNQLEIISESNDLRSETGTVPHPVSITSAGGKVYLCDTTNGIYTFDRYGAYLNTLPFKKAHQVQVLNHQLIWYTNSKLHVYQLKNFQSNEIKLPASTQNAVIYRNRIYLQKTDDISIFYLTND